MREPRQKFDPRSPVQPGRDATPAVVIAALAVLGAWTAWTLWPAGLAISGAASLLRDRAPLIDRPEDERSSKTGVTGLIGPDDYPPDAADNNEQGTVHVQLHVGIDGHVDGCDIVGSSGWQSLDRATCRIFSTRARFKPARDASGRTVPDTLNQEVTWRLAD